MLPTSAKAPTGRDEKIRIGRCTQMSQIRGPVQHGDQRQRKTCGGMEHTGRGDADCIDQAAGPYWAANADAQSKP